MRLARVTVLLLVLSLWAGRAFAAVSADLTDPVPRSQGWELLKVALSVPPGGGTVAIQDARGGLTVVRSLDAALADPASSQSLILLPLPFVAPAVLPGDSWPVKITVQSAGGEAQVHGVVIARPSALGRASGDAGSFRIAGMSTANLQPNDHFDRINPAPAVFLPLTDDDILTGPPLLLAAADAVVLSDPVAAQLSPDRIAALLGSGIQLVSRKLPADIANPVLARLAWTQVPSAPGASPLWATAPREYPGPKVLEPGLATARSLDVQAQPNSLQTAAVILVPIAALVVLLLARGLFHRPALVLIVSLIGLGCLGAGAIAYLRSSDIPLHRAVAWTTSLAPPPGAGPSTVFITETFTASSPLFARHLHITAEQDQFLYPVAASPRRYFAMKDARLTLDSLSDNGLRRISRLELPLVARGSEIYALRSAAILPADSADAHGGWIEGGYITSAAPHSAGAAEAPVLLTQWAGEHAALSASLRAWYEMRFLAAHRYFLHEPFDADALTLTDFGIPAAPLPAP